MEGRPSPTPEALVPVDILTFRKATRDINFDVYLKLSETNYVHIFSRTTGLDYKRLAQYIQKGIRELYIHKSDEEAYKKFISRSAESIFLDPNTPQERKIASLLNMTEQNMSEIFSQFNLEKETLERTQKLVKNYVELMTDSPQTLTLILKLVSHGEYLYYHSIAVAIFSMFIARSTGKLSQEMIERVGMGGFLHDIGCTQIQKEILSSPKSLTTEQWKEMHTHPSIGLKMVENSENIPDEVKYIIYQHHEQPDGNGYPNRLKANKIYPPASIVAIADSFSALISDRPFRPAYTVDQAINIIEESQGKYDKNLVKLFASIFRTNTKIEKGR